MRATYSRDFLSRQCLPQRTTPNEAKTILNSQPQIAYALMAMMVNINAVKTEIVQVRFHVPQYTTHSS